MESYLVQMFLKVLNMSITAAYVALFVCIVRLALKKLPKVISYSLWLAVLFRLLCPVSFSSAISLLGLGNVSSASKGGSLSYVGNPAPALSPVTLRQTAVPVSGDAHSVSGAGPSFIETLALFAAFIWAVGVIAMLAISVISHIRLKRSINGAALLYGNVYESGNIPSPFVYGIIKPRIYLPAGMSGKDLVYVLSHERMHIARRDNVVKPIAYLALCLHWFNPVMWVAFRLMCRDMEMSCDEKVLRNMEENDKAGYGEALLRLAASRSVLADSPLAFGESSVKARIKNVLAFRKPVYWIAAAAVIAAAAIGVCLIANPGPAAPVSAGELYGNYRFEKQVYMNGLSSFLAFDDYVQYYTLTKDALTITEASGERQSFDIGYAFSDVSDQDFKTLFMPDLGVLDISQFNQKHQYTLCEPNEFSPGYTLYLMDSEVWLAKINSGKDGVNYIWSIYRIEKYGGVMPAGESAATEGPEAVSSAISSLETNFSQGGVEISLYVGGEEIHDIVIEGEAQMQAVRKAVSGFTQNSAVWKGERRRPPGNFMSLSWDFGSSGFYIFDKDGNHCIQNEESGIYSILDDETYNSLLETALGYQLANVMTVVSGKNSIYAFENTLWTQLGDLHGVNIRLKSEQVADYLQYISIAPGSGELTPFTPYVDGKKVYGRYRLYDKDFKEIPFFEPSGLDPQTYIFHDVQWPGTYIVELETSNEINSFKMENQYFFGVILPEKPGEPLK